MYLKKNEQASHNIAHDNLHIQTVVDLQRVRKNSAIGGHGQTDSVPQEVAGKC